MTEKFEVDSTLHFIRAFLVLERFLLCTPSVFSGFVFAFLVVARLLLCAQCVFESFLLTAQFVLEQLLIRAFRLVERLLLCEPFLLEKFLLLCSFIFLEQLCLYFFQICLVSRDKLEGCISQLEFNSALRFRSFQLNSFSLKLLRG